ncbi:MAG: hypothetical protein FWC89_11885, partial [Defluviitaleaceae bacterium]|nr:hypothetical protein [Defluviitaleaceae bacterium]
LPAFLYRLGNCSWLRDVCVSFTNTCNRRNAALPLFHMLGNCSWLRDVCVSCQYMSYVVEEMRLCRPPIDLWFVAV